MGISLRDAIAAAIPGDTIEFSVTGTINLSVGPTDFDRHLTVDKNLTINGPGAILVTINAFDPTRTANNGDGSRMFVNKPTILTPAATLKNSPPMLFTEKISFCTINLWRGFR